MHSPFLALNQEDTHRRYPGLTTGAPFMPELRKAPRVAGKHHGVVSIPGRPDIACSIRDVSNLGARLSFSNPIILPRIFHLKFDGVEQRVTVIWQSGKLAGVRFHLSLKGIGGARKKRLWPWSRK